jgi:hypothetical protein
MYAVGERGSVTCPPVWLKVIEVLAAALRVPVKPACTGEFGSKLVRSQLTGAGLWSTIRITDALPDLTTTPTSRQSPSWRSEGRSEVISEIAVTLLILTVHLLEVASKLSPDPFNPRSSPATEASP